MVYQNKAEKGKETKNLSDFNGEKWCCERGLNSFRRLENRRISAVSRQSAQHECDLSMDSECDLVICGEQRAIPFGVWRSDAATTVGASVNIFDLSDDEMDGLPEQPEEAFAYFVRLAEAKFNERIVQIRKSATDEESWTDYLDAKLSFMSVVNAAAKHWSISVIAELPVPAVDDFSDQTYRQFRSDLDHYMTQIVLGSAARRRQATVSLTTDARSNIRILAQRLRAAIDEAEVEPGRKRRLLKRVDDLLTELDKQRISIHTVAYIAYELLAAPGALYASYQLGEAVTQLVRQFEYERETEDGLLHLPGLIEVPALSPPPRPMPRPAIAHGPPAIREDDEIPF